MEIKNRIITTIFANCLMSSVSAEENIPKPTRAEDILDSKSSTLDINGVTGRKGMFAAFLRNIDVIESPHTSEVDKKEAIVIMKQIAQVMVALGADKKAKFYNQTAQNIMCEARKNMQS